MKVKGKKKVWVGWCHELLNLKWVIHYGMVSDKKYKYTALGKSRAKKIRITVEEI